VYKEPKALLETFLQFHAGCQSRADRHPSPHPLQHSSHQLNPIPRHSEKSEILQNIVLLSSFNANGQTPGARFSKAPETFRARKAIFRSSVPKIGEVYTPETSCMK